MSNGSIVKKVNAFNDYVGNVSNRDRVMSVVQFTAMALMDPAAVAGCPNLSAHFNTVLHLAAHYRSMTRFSQWFVVGPALTPSGIRAVIKSNPNPWVGICKTISTAFFTVFLIGEEVVMGSKCGMVDPVLGKKFNRIRFVFLFWSNIARLLMNYLLLKQSTFDAAKDAQDADKVKDQKRRVLSVADSVLQSTFCYTLMKNSVPAGPSHMCAAFNSGNIVDIITAFAPPLCIVPNTPQGIIGLVASVPGFMMSVL
ncbi:putative mitochondrial Gim5A protein,glycosomal membrane protein (gim5A) [Leptomonas pyrrhocoris]|uniref:Putative mitochondrial Gim5A protein,glycosomal membrane protein (Gim5A) n=1 Tax=Leptomonas pyrrhocoris TaxID=157538 RepID=A0A0N0VI36_LEPPY|nr:putative mitochondrial Gim5A protein,glycosomal membrane protein (gim5A) [Leptomonas pyrrhocoris]XP_015664877.1 putative mitochondrial Gim5A protein,glycosomal membrane protein (gim5A) [Leptomonas pyrrhocoris]KPA86437.1 putative mitochondrial Gim5A protein,glycosomal membrane protein (gim5A) [Leptomonas pyrrhocoris]KPA86438.1 putative mitochondrial Gim5A protein,glycosomal membrane protein (gim5A) [Leptomonas pyrrhocoris]|eukprot:XP_015664876.1 putative mitochondrial Gim5A protein,glycosomal membrane protein (gim5A) [Leptomonas pyrrhocoris]